MILSEISKLIVLVSEISLHLLKSKNW